MDSAVVVIAQIIPVLLLGVLAEIRTVLLEGRRTWYAYAAAAVIFSIALVLLYVEATLIGLLADTKGTSALMTGNDAATLVYWIFGFFGASTLLTALIVIDARRPPGAAVSQSDQGSLPASRKSRRRMARAGGA